VQNKEAEQSVLGAILVKPEILPEICTILTPESFYRGAHSSIFRAMVALQERQEPVDLVTVTLALRERKKLDEVGGPGFLAGLSEEVGFATNAIHYAHRIQDAYRARQLAAKARDIAQAAEEFSVSDGRIEDIYLFAESTLQDAMKAVDFNGPELVTAPQLLAKDFTQAVPVVDGGVLPELCNLLIVGESGDGKSMLRLQLGIHLAEGRDFCGLGIPKARRVLIIQFENTEHLEQIRLRRMLRGLGIECPVNLIFLSPLGRFDLGEKLDCARLIALIQQSEAEVTIFDPLSSMHRVNENANSEMRWILDNLTEVGRRTGTSAILVHHYGKSGKEEMPGVYRTRGATAIRDWADTIIGFSRKKHNDLVLRTLEFFKVRNGPEPKPIVVSRDLETFLHHVTDGESLCSPAKVAAILEGLGGESGRSPLLRAIQSAVGCQERQAREFLYEAVKQRYVCDHGDPKDSRRKVYSIV